MKLHNRWLLISSLFVILIILALLYRAGKLSPVSVGTDQVPPAALGDPINMDLPELPLEAILETDAKTVSKGPSFISVMQDLIKCAGLQVEAPVAELPLTSEAVSSFLQSSLGPATTVDRWMSWNLRLWEGSERQVRLEVLETDSGDLRRELQFFNINIDGSLVLVPTSPEYNDPSDEKISQVLKEGQVIGKEKAGAALFASGERFEYLETNETLAKIEFYKDDTVFSCSDILNQAHCQCINP
jgi:hypothetical protein